MTNRSVMETGEHGGSDGAPTCRRRLNGVGATLRAFYKCLELWLRRIFQHDSDDFEEIMRQLIACLTISVVVSLLGCTRTTLEENQVVFRPTIDKIGQVSCSWEQGSQRFKLFHPDFDSLIRLSPGGDDGQSSYFLYVSIEADGSQIDRIKNVTVALLHSQSGGAASSKDDFQLTRVRPPGSPMNEDHLQWWSEFDISPDIAPGVHRNLEIRLVVQYQTKDGHTDTLDVTVPIEPIEITIPTSIH